MKKLFFLLPLLTMFLALSSCGGDGDSSDNEPQSTPVYKVRVYNNIDKSQISSSKSDGNLYEVYIIEMSEKFPYQKVGTVTNKNYVTVTLDSNFSGTDKIVMCCKIGKTESKANSSTFYSPESSYGKSQYVTLKDGEVSTFTIDDNTTWSTFDCSNITDLIKELSTASGL